MKATYLEPGYLMVSDNMGQTRILTNAQWAHFCEQNEARGAQVA